jgi:protein required for attachment to host cells
MSTTWILIANSSHANLYQTHKGLLFGSNGHAAEKMCLLQSFDHVESRKKISELVSGKAGKYQCRTSGHGSYSEATDPKTVEAMRFARELAEFLDSGRVEDEYDDLIIVAPPHFQGLLQKCITQQLQKRVSRTVEKDYTNFKGRYLVSQLMPYI